MGRLALMLSVSLLAACATAVDEEDAGDLFDDAEVEGDGGLAFDIVTKPDIVVEPDVRVAIDATDVTDASDRPTAPDVVSDDRGGVPGVCANATSCGACTGLVGCGWCGATSVCVAGTLNGPSGGRCEAGWSWSPSRAGPRRTRAPRSRTAAPASRARGAAGAGRRPDAPRRTPPARAPRRGPAPGCGRGSRSRAP